MQFEGLDPDSHEKMVFLVCDYCLRRTQPSWLLVREQRESWACSKLIFLDLHRERWRLFDQVSENHLKLLATIQALTSVEQDLFF